MAKATPIPRQKRRRPIKAGLLQQLADGAITHASGSGVRVAKHGGSISISAPREVRLARLGTYSNPATIGSTGESETAMVDTWDRSAQVSGEHGVDEIRLTRFAYSDTGDQTLYAFYRTYGLDSRGSVATISAETRVSIDVTEAC